MAKDSLMKKMSISTLANLFEIIVSLITTLVFPKILSEISYSYWQVYVFYIGFVTIAGFGLVEGIYLLNGGKKFDTLDKSRHSFYTWWVVGASIVVFSLVYLVSNAFISDSDLLFIILFVCIEGIIFNIREYPMYLLQSTDRIKEFSIGVVLDRACFILTLVLFFAFGKNGITYFMIADIIGHICCMVYAYCRCKSKLLCKPGDFKTGINDVRNSIKIGFNLLMANMLGVMIIGTVKYGIQVNWSILEFGKISLVITCTNLFMKFATAVSFALFPTLCNYNEEQLSNVYKPLSYLIEIAMFVVMIFYYPVRLVLSAYLPNYASSFEYMGYLLPICLFQIKVSLIFNTYFKALRHEKVLMRVNVATLLLGVALTLLSAFWLHNLLLCVLTILIILAFRSFVMERILVNKILKLGIKSCGLFGIVMSVVFVACNGLVGGWIGAISYAFVIIIMVFMEKRKLKDHLNKFILKLKRA